MIHESVTRCKGTVTREVKEQQWQAMATHVAQMKDKLGKGIDPGILETVVVLNLLGLPTTQSCEGHLDRAAGAPWIDIGDTRADSQSREVESLFRVALQAQQQHTQPPEEVNQLFVRAHQAQLEVMRIQLVIRHKLMSYLAAFYEHHSAPYDVRLVIQAQGATGRCRLESQGADFQDIASLEVRQKKLVEYQEEMRAFTAFLKEQYFAEEAMHIIPTGVQG